MERSILGLFSDESHLIDPHIRRLLRSVRRFTGSLLAAPDHSGSRRSVPGGPRVLENVQILAALRLTVARPDLVE